MDWRVGIAIFMNSFVVYRLKIDLNTFLFKGTVSIFTIPQVFFIYILSELQFVFK